MLAASAAALKGFEMSYCVFFSFSEGLSSSLLVPQGTLRALQDHVAWVEEKLKINVEEYGGKTRWKSLSHPFGDGVDDGTLCEVARTHNAEVRWLYGKFEEWSEAKSQKKAPEGVWVRSSFRDEPPWRFQAYGFHEFPPPEELTPEQAQTFWRGLQEISVPTSRWTRGFYVDRMQHLYEVMRGRENEGVTFNARKCLSPKQAAAVVELFSAYLDDHDMRLDVPNGYDYLASSYDGGYDWCEKCGPTHPDDVGGCRKKACPLRAEREESEPEEYRRRWVVKDKAAGVYLGRAPGEWPDRLDKRVLRLADRDAAVAQTKLYPQRALVVVPVRRP